jgi:hypothetical protein
MLAEPLCVADPPRAPGTVLAAAVGEFWLEATGFSDDGS